jgi:hypothetical protein
MIVTTNDDKVYDSYDVDMSFMMTEPQLSKVIALRTGRKQKFYGEKLVAGSEVIEPSRIKSVKISQTEMDETISKMSTRCHDVFHASREGGWSRSKKRIHVRRLKKKVEA